MKQPAIHGRHMTMKRPTQLSAKTDTYWALKIRHTWDGEAVGIDETVAVTMELGEGELTLEIDAPFHDDPPPDSDDLWTYEVVEVMLVGEDDTYLEVELSPHGQYLVLFLHGERNVVRRGDHLDFRVDLDVDRGRWHGVAQIPTGWLPLETDRLNAFAMHGTQSQRRHLAWKPTGGPEPDFHRLSTFGSLAECARDRRESC